MSQTDYDLVDYGGSEQTLAAPNLIAGVARYLGMRTASPSRARVLELGCGNASHLIPLAWYWPDAQFVGIDLALSPIEQGRERASQLGLTNLRLEQADVTALSPAGIGSFDYVIAHGLMSWIPPFVREATFALIGACLAPGGVAYLSYNAYPGCRIRHLTRDLMRYHLIDEPYSLATAQKARVVLEQVAAVPTDQRPPFFEHIGEEATKMLGFSTNYLFHDDLSPENHAFYLHEFAGMAARHGLSYLGDPELGRMFEPEGQPALSAWLDQMSGGEWLKRHQYLDFAIGTRFRRTLLCRTQDSVQPAPTMSALSGLRFFSGYVPQGPCNPADESVAHFRNAAGREVSTDAPVIKAVLLMAGQSPRHTIGIDDLARLAAHAPLEQARIPAAQAFERLLRNGMLYPIAEEPAPAPDQASGEGFPPLSALTRFYLERGLSVVDHLHRGRPLSDTAFAQVLLKWDGRQSVAQFAAQARADAAGASPAGIIGEEALRSLLTAMQRDSMLGARPAGA